MKERYLANRCFDNYDDIVDAACEAWNKVTNDKEAISKLTSRVILPFLVPFKSKNMFLINHFLKTGGIPPKPICGLSLLYIQIHSVDCCLT